MDILIKNFIKIISLILLTIFMFSCSNDKKDFEDIKDLEKETNNIIYSTQDIHLKIKSCDNVINALNEFLTNRKINEWTKLAETDLELWKNRKAEFIQESDYLAVKQVASSSFLAIEKSNDYSENLSSCEKVITATNNFLQTYKQGKWLEITDNLNWKVKQVKDILEEEFKILSQRLDLALHEHAINQANKDYPLHRLKDIKLITKQFINEPNKIIRKKTYYIIMELPILKTIKEINLLVSGYIDSDLKTLNIEGNSESVSIWGSIQQLENKRAIIWKEISELIK